MSKRIFFLATFFILSATLYAVDYYISNNGNDANNGTTPSTPWKTLSKLSQELGGPNGTWGTISNGDRIFFNRGDVFVGTIAFSAYNNNGIVFDAYGTGAKPIIKGSEPCTNWTNHSGNIWKMSMNKRVHFLYVNGNLATLAKIPNSDFWLTTATSNTSLQANEILTAGVNLVGSNACIREFDWRLNRKIVTSHTANSVSWAVALDGVPKINSNVYFDNKYEFIDVPWEWYWDSAANVLYLMTDGTNPNSHEIEASVNEFGILGNDNRSNNTIQHLTFLHFANQAIRLMGASDYNQINNCNFEDNFTAIFLSGSFSNIKNNYINNAYYQGMILANMQNSTCESNTLKNLGMVYGLTRPDFLGDFYSGGIWLINALNGATIINNIIDSAGNMGIRFNGSGILIESNKISNVMVNMDDGGAIYTFGGGNSSYNNQIRKNIIHDLVGSNNGFSPGNIINAIYIDNYAYNITIEDNTVFNILGGSGIVINAGAHSCTILNNVTYKCLLGLSFYDWKPGKSIFGNIAKHNTIYANQNQARAIEIASDDNNYNVLSICDSNFLINPYDSIIATFLWSNPAAFTFQQWQQITGYDQASNSAFYQHVFPNDHSFLLVNDSSVSVSYDFSNLVIFDLFNQQVFNLTLPPFSSAILFNLTPLPIKLANFYGIVANNNQVDLFWSSFEERNLHQIIVEKSEDGKHFDAIGVVLPRNFPSKYQFSDTNFLQSAFYRLAIEGTDGKIEKSKIVFMRKQVRDSRFNIFVNNNILTTNQNEIEDIEQILIFDAVGKLLMQASQLPLVVNHLPKGLIVVWVKSSTGFYAQKIVL